ncbi:hypothetical protein C8R44DRAFT_652582 [Mycena epipterygia]|nr:hypothetical protein C8R44DRAFT_652582 [Mycena epipterygia]
MDTDSIPLSPESLTRVDELWFPDHGLVLQADNRLFRVSGGILAARSPVFRDMLSIPQPESQPLIDGCPVVVLHDSAADAEYFLKAIFDSSFFERPPAPTTFPIVAGVLRLSTKYDVEYLRRRALRHLASALPSSLAEYDAMVPTAGILNTANSEFPCLLLVHSLAITWAMPVAMYIASCEPVELIIDGIHFDGDHVQLPPSLQRACLIARAAIAVSQNHEAFRFLRCSPIAGCRSHELCQLSRHSLLEQFTKIDQVDPLAFMHPAVWSTFQPLLCDTCYAAAETEHRASRQKIWDEFPVIFNLATWEELNARRKADLDD